MILLVLLLQTLRCFTNSWICSSCCCSFLSGINTLLAKSIDTFFNNDKSTFSSGPRNLPTNPTYCIIFDKYIFEKFRLADYLFLKALKRLTTFLFVNDNLWGKLAFSSHFAAYFVVDFNLFICESDNFTVVLSHFILVPKLIWLFTIILHFLKKKQKKYCIHRTFWISCKITLLYLF